MATIQVEQNVNQMDDGVRPHIEAARQRLGRLGGRLTGFIQDHPAACLVGALALGYLVAHVMRRRD